MTGTVELTHIDWLISSSKKLAGQLPLVWTADPNQKDHKARIKTPIIIDGETIGQFFFITNAVQYSGNHLEVMFILAYRDFPIERMRFNPLAPHTNQMISGMPKKLKGLTLPAHKSRYYPWAENRGFGFPPEKHSKNLPAAELITEEIPDFVWAVIYFFRRSNIELVGIESPPFKQLSLI